MHVIQCGTYYYPFDILLYLKTKLIMVVYVTEPYQ